MTGGVFFSSICTFSILLASCFASAQNKLRVSDEKVIAEYLVDKHEIPGEYLKTKDYSTTFYGEDVVRSGTTYMVKFSTHSAHSGWYLYLHTKDSTSFIKCEDIISDWGSIYYFLKKIQKNVTLEVVNKIIYCYPIKQELYPNLRRD